MTFKPGDRVVCVNDRNIDMVKSGEIYTVEIVAPSGRSVLLRECGPLGFNISRFKRVSDHSFAASNETTENLLGTVSDLAKPPLGLKPRSVHTNERILDIKDACNRYIAEKKDIPHEWISELFDLEDLE